MVDERSSLGELAALFLRLGATAFGGPAAHLAMMEDEVVRRRRWLDQAGFLDLLGATNLIPGPNSTEMAIHIGYARRGWAGLVVAGLAFIVPAALITAACGWAYVRYGALPAAGWLLKGVKPVILGVIARAIVGLAPRAMRTVGLGVIAGAAGAAAAAGVHELAVIGAAGAGGVLVAAVGGRPAAPGKGTAGAAGAIGAVSAAGVASAAGAGAVGAGAVGGSVGLVALFAVFCRIGAVLFGSGYVLVAFLRSELVERLGWLSEAQLIDAVAVGQVTPGPVFTTATFVGYLLRGPEGALVATAGIFAPAFVFVALSGPLVPRLRASRRAGAFLDGVNAASLALMVVVTVQLGRAAIVDAPTLVIALVGGLALVRYQVNATWLIAGGAAAGLVLHALGIG